jgi:hypothetical protein
MLIGASPLRAAAPAYAYGIAAGWVVLMIAIAASGGFAPGVIGPVPGPVLGFGALVIGLSAWFWWPAFRDTLLGLPPAALIGINAFRIAGVFFLILFAQGRLSAPFAQSAGWGDIITGLVAIPLAAMTAVGTVPSRRHRRLNALVLIYSQRSCLGRSRRPERPFDCSPKVRHRGDGDASLGNHPDNSCATLAARPLTLAWRLRSAPAEHRSRSQLERHAPTRGRPRPGVVEAGAFARSALRSAETSAEIVWPVGLVISHAPFSLATTPGARRR